MNATAKGDKLRLCRSDDESRARFSRLRASSPGARQDALSAPLCREGNVMVMLRCRRNESPRRVSTRSHRYRATIPSTRARNPREVATRFSSLEEATCCDKSFSRLHLPSSLSWRTALHSVHAIGSSRLFPTTYPSIFHRIPVQSRLLRSISCSTCSDATQTNWT